jgi:sugar phosphate isomerase/epimerase
MKKHQIGLQLYTLREHCKTASDLASSLSKIRKIGYEAIEYANTGISAAKEVRLICDSEGIKICSSHEDPKLILNEPGKVVERLAEFGCTIVGYPYPRDVDLSSAKEVEQLALNLEQSAQILKASGIKLAYHNHGLEFFRLGKKTVLETLFELAPSLGAEPDVCWIQYGGGSPEAWLRRLAGRMPIVHLKDLGFDLKANKAIPVELGNGTLDLPAITKEATAAGAEWFIVEQDECPADAFYSVKVSYDYAIANLLI